MQQQTSSGQKEWVYDFVFFQIPASHTEQYNQLWQEWKSIITQNGGMQREGGCLWFKGPERPDSLVEEFDDSCQHPIRKLPSPSQSPDSGTGFTYTLHHINAVSEPLGIPWEASKDQPFGSTFTYLGFLWDIGNKIVRLIEHKQAKYCHAIQEWNQSSKHALDQTEKLHGKLLHATLIMPAGCAYLTGLECLMAMQHDKPWIPIKSPKGTDYELSWWSYHLSSPTPPRTIPAPQPIADVKAFSDASSGVGVAFLVGQKWKAWRLLPGWQTDGRDIAWAESIALELMAHAVIEEHGQDKEYRIYCDNWVVVDGWHKGRSHNRHINLTFHCLHILAEQTGCKFHTRYVPSELNPADGPSRGQLPQHPPSFGPIQPDPSLANFFIDATLPHTQRETRAI